jgi:protein phosphatase
MRIEIPEYCLVVVVGATMAERTSFVSQHFRESEILPEAASDSHLEPRMRSMLLAVVAGAENSAGLRPYLDAARHCYLTLAGIVLKQDPRQHWEKVLAKEGFHQVYSIGPAELSGVELVRIKAASNRKDETGPFDIIGDVHGCCDELEELMAQLGYSSEGRHALGNRKLIFVGDLVDRGPRVLDTIRTVQRMVSAGNALCVPGNHDEKLMRWLKGHKVTVAHGLQQSIDELQALPIEERSRIGEFLEGLVSHYVLDSGNLVVAHAGVKELMHGRMTRSVLGFCLFGQPTGVIDQYGLPVRYDWAADYRGAAMVVYGHTPVPSPVWVNNTINIDTGCVFGGRLTALRYPERELVSVVARRVYAKSLRPFPLSKRDA